MTTFEEISTCERANRDYWTQHARFCLLCYRQTGCPLELSGFRAAMRNRRNKKYFEGRL